MYAIADYLAGSLITHDVIQPYFLTESAQSGPCQRISVMTTAVVNSAAVLKAGKHSRAGAYSQWSTGPQRSLLSFVHVCSQKSLSLFGAVSL